MRIPPIITAGDSISWVDVAFADSANNPINSGSYSLTYSFRGPQVTGSIDVSGTAKGTDWTLSLTTAQTAALNASSSSLVWSWQAFATKTGVRVTAGAGTVRVMPNLAALSTSAAFDGRSQSEIDLAAVRAEMTARVAGGATVEYSINTPVGNRSLRREPMAALVAMEQRYLRIIAREKRAAASANGLGNPGRVSVRFA